VVGNCMAVLRSYRSHGNIRESRIAHIWPKAHAAPIRNT
jgi:hypothetical protein